jgi:hypothetical protein
VFCSSKHASKLKGVKIQTRSSRILNYFLPFEREIALSMHIVLSWLLQLRIIVSSDAFYTSQEDELRRDSFFPFTIMHQSISWKSGIFKSVQLIGFKIHSWPILSLILHACIHKKSFRGPKCKSSLSLINLPQTITSAYI